MDQRMKVYLAGPMRGHPQLNFPTFHAEAARLRAQGHEVFNPAERDNYTYGTDISVGNLHGDEDLAAKEHGFDPRVALESDLVWICRHAEQVAMLPGWQSSKGACVERAVAQALGLEVVYL